MLRFGDRRSRPLQRPLGLRRSNLPRRRAAAREHRDPHPRLLSARLASLSPSREREGSDLRLLLLLVLVPRRSFRHLAGGLVAPVGLTLAPSHILGDLIMALRHLVLVGLRFVLPLLCHGISPSR